MKLKYEAADARDAETLYAFNKELIDTYEDTDKMEYDKVLLWVRKKIEKNINEYTRVTLDGKTVGYFYFHKADGENEIDDLYVLPEYRGRGIGTEIINKCIKEIVCISTPETLIQNILLTQMNISQSNQLNI